MQIFIREGTLQDLPFLSQMSLEAANWHLSEIRPSLQKGLSQPGIANLIEGWGREGDISVIAESLIGEQVGAAWYRYWNNNHHSSGYVSDVIPELKIAVCLDWRRRGVGSILLSTLKQKACEQGVKYISLSVEKDNPARNLYLQNGFRPVRQVGNVWTMVTQVADRFL
ncbi:GNAT family N-acetyltransferase [Acaryochloris marina]|uniref:GNAT family N-acetyltransferase n=1 Tax=Acaryochloris marina TaxID=155978 RepID=UPI001BAFA2BB|nr:GNAT family N-acetyltransferase [Acaryochloris marina]QUY44833.1 GNAT family N-acetyltransferase [Acaryochloris marina S15]